MPPDPTKPTTEYLYPAMELTTKSKTMQVKINNASKHELPKYAKPGDAGMDLRANTEFGYGQTLQPFERALIPTGISLQLDKGYEAQIRPRSGLALKHGITVLNSPGTIDSSYRGEIKVLLINLSNEPFIIEDGERIAQMVIASHETVNWLESVELEATERGAGGYGSTGKN